MCSVFLTCSFFFPCLTLCPSLFSFVPSFCLTHTCSVSHISLSSCLTPPSFPASVSLLSILPAQLSPVSFIYFFSQPASHMVGTDTAGVTICRYFPQPHNSLAPDSGSLISRVSVRWNMQCYTSRIFHGMSPDALLLRAGLLLRVAPVSMLL